jgi:transcriptional antiterminator NusG
VVRAISGKENKIKEMIESEVLHSGMKDHVDQVLIPTEKVYQIRKGKKSKQGEKFLSWLHIIASQSYW